MDIAGAAKSHKLASILATVTQGLDVGIIIADPPSKGLPAELMIDIANCVDKAFRNKPTWFLAFYLPKVYLWPPSDLPLNNQMKIHLHAVSPNKSHHYCLVSELDLAHLGPSDARCQRARKFNTGSMCKYQLVSEFISLATSFKHDILLSCRRTALPMIKVVGNEL